MGGQAVNQEVNPVIQQITELINTSVGDGQDPKDVVMGLIEQEVDQQMIAQAFMQLGYEEEDIINLFKQVQEMLQPPPPATPNEQTINPQQIARNQKMTEESQEEMAMAKSGIEIKPENEGKFTKWATARGMSVQEAASKVMSNTDKYPASVVKMANFAKNAAGWKKEMGGEKETVNSVSTSGQYYVKGGEFKPHFMYKGERKIRAKDMATHLRLKDAGYVHELDKAEPGLETGIKPQDKLTFSNKYINPIAFESGNDFSIINAAGVLTQGYQDLFGGDKNGDGTKDGAFRDWSRKGKQQELNKGSYYDYNIDIDKNDPNTYMFDGKIDLYNASKKGGNLSTKQEFEDRVNQNSFANFNAKTGEYDKFSSAQDPSMYDYETLFGQKRTLLDKEAGTSDAVINARKGENLNYFSNYRNYKDNDSTFNSIMDFDKETTDQTLPEGTTFGIDAKGSPRYYAPNEENPYMYNTMMGYNKTAPMNNMKLNEQAFGGQLPKYQAKGSVNVSDVGNFVSNTAHATHAAEGAVHLLKNTLPWVGRVSPVLSKLAWPLAVADATYQFGKVGAESFDVVGRGVQEDFKNNNNTQWQNDQEKGELTKRITTGNQFPEATNYYDGGEQTSEEQFKMNGIEDAYRTHFDATGLNSIDPQTLPYGVSDVGTNTTGYGNTKWSDGDGDYKNAYNSNSSISNAAGVDKFGVRRPFLNRILNRKKGNMRVADINNRFDIKKINKEYGSLENLLATGEYQLDQNGEIVNTPNVASLFNSTITEDGDQSYNKGYGRFVLPNEANDNQGGFYTHMVNNNDGNVNFNQTTSKSAEDYWKNFGQYYDSDSLQNMYSNPDSIRMLNETGFYGSPAENQYKRYGGDLLKAQDGIPNPSFKDWVLQDPMTRSGPNAQAEYNKLYPTENTPQVNTNLNATAIQDQSPFPGYNPPGPLEGGQTDFLNTNTQLGSDPTLSPFQPPKVTRTNNIEGGLNRLADNRVVNAFAATSNFGVKAAGVANDWFRDKRVQEAKADNFMNFASADGVYGTYEDPFAKRGNQDLNTGILGSDANRVTGLYLTKYGGETNIVNVNSDILAKLIAAGADIEIL